MKISHKYMYIYILLLIILIWWLSINCQSHVESFTPQIRQMYNPIARKCRTYTNHVIEHFKTKSINLLKKSNMI
jgi:hypothetical protein